MNVENKSKDQNLVDKLERESLPTRARYELADNPLAGDVLDLFYTLKVVQKERDCLKEVINQVREVVNEKTR